MYLRDIFDRIDRQDRCIYIYVDWIHLLEVYLQYLDISTLEVYLYYNRVEISDRYRVDTYQIDIYMGRYQIDGNTGQILNIYLDIPIDEDTQQLKENIEVAQLDILKYRLNRLRYLIDRYQINRDVCQIQKRPLKQVKVPTDKDLNNWRRLQKEETKLYIR